jgi:hypothetical protein
VGGKVARPKATVRIRMIAWPLSKTATPSGLMASVSAANRLQTGRSGV